MSNDVTIRVTTDTVGKMIQDAMKDKYFREFVVSLLKSSYRLDAVMDAIHDGIPTPKYKVGDELFCTREGEFYLAKGDANGENNPVTAPTGNCKIVRYEVGDVHSPYTVEVDIINKDGSADVRTLWCSESELQPI